MEKLKWETRKVKVKDLVQLDINPRKISEEKKQKLIESLDKFNLVEIPAVNTDLQIIGGNQRVTALLVVGRGEEEIDVRFPNRKLTKKEVKEYAIISNTHAGEFDFDILNLEFTDIDFNDIIFNLDGLSKGLDANEMIDKDVEHLLNEDFDSIGNSSNLLKIVITFDGKQEAESWLNSVNLSNIVKRQGQAWQINLNTQFI